MTSHNATVTLYQTKGPGLVIARSPDNAGERYVAGDHMAGAFAHHAQAWIACGRAGDETPGWTTGGRGGDGRCCRSGPAPDRGDGFHWDQGRA
jgi:hypothetical protein